MLSFPTQYNRTVMSLNPNWRTALLTTSPTDGGTGSRFGRSASLILPRLYLSDYFTARDDSELARLGITHVISVIEHHPTIPDSIVDRHKLHVCIADRPDVDILLHLEETTEFIRLALAENKSNKVLVCSALFICFLGET
jgi:atypical dual specificity phosphatase